MQAVTTIGLDIAPRIRLMAFDLGTCCVCPGRTLATTRLSSRLARAGSTAKPSSHRPRVR
jgi:hypothetical protein